MNEIVIALITGGLSLLGVIITNKNANDKMMHSLDVTQAVTAEKIAELEKKMDKHNNIIERTYHLEERDTLHSEQIKVINHRLEDLESYHKGA